MSMYIKRMTSDEVDITRATAALKEAAPAKKVSRKESFEKLIPEVQDAINRKVPLQKIREILEQCGLKMSMATFRKLLMDSGLVSPRSIVAEQTEKTVGAQR